MSPAEALTPVATVNALAIHPTPRLGLPRTKSSRPAGGDRRAAQTVRNSDLMWMLTLGACS